MRDEALLLQKNLSKGHTLRAEDLTYKRPGTGISPLHWDEVLNRKLTSNVVADHILQWQDLNPA